jgi:hypothetical protein
MTTSSSSSSGLSSSGVGEAESSSSGEPTAWADHGLDAGLRDAIAARLAARRA